MILEVFSNLGNSVFFPTVVLLRGTKTNCFVHRDSKTIGLVVFL